MRRIFNGLTTCLTCLTCLIFVITSSVVQSVASAQDKATQEPTTQEPATEKLYVGIERAFESLRFDRPICLTGAGDGSGRIFVAEQSGVVRVFSQNSEQPESKIFLDIQDRVSRASNEQGLIGFAFHPDFKNNGLLFVHYSTTVDVPAGTPAPNVLSSFKVSTDNPDRADRESEKIIFTQSQPYSNHNGGMIAFGNDGYLYVSLGDGGDANDPHGHGQNVETLLGSIIRIDVDRQENGKQYAIPADNPFLNLKNARPELWAIGLRNVWRFSIDPKTGDLWAADVGQNLWEEVNIVRAGGNYGWNRIEAKSKFNEKTELATEPAIEPVAIYGHEWGGSITGGCVYRGKKFPQLDGSYFYGDYMTGNLWRLKQSVEGNYKNELVRRTGRSIASFGYDDDGEVYLVSFDGGIYRIVPSEKPEDTFGDWPEQLADTGLFESITQQKVASHLLPYTVNAPFWSDTAEKDRFLVLPEGEKMGYRETGSWTLPVGTTIVKNFELAGRKRNQMIETRLIKRVEDGWQAATYVWDKKNKSATLYPNGSQTERWFAGSMNSWHAPSASECSACHVDAAGYVLGLNTAQLNCETADGKNQIELWAAQGKLDLPAEFKLAQADQFCSPTDETADLETRARVWMDVNCAMCHRPQGSGNANIDLRFDTPLELTKTVDVKPSQNDLSIENALLIAPGEPNRSIMLQRINTRSAGAMPNIGSNVVDPTGIKLLTEWIEGMKVID